MKSLASQRGPTVLPDVRPRGLAAIAAMVALGAAAVGAPIAVGAEQSEVQRGAAILDAVQSGQRNCRDLSGAGFEAVGEFAMQRMAGSTQAHEAMDRAMTRMMGSGGLDSMHRYMGERFSGCARGPAPRGIAGITGMMGMMGGSGRGFGPGMMGRGFAPGSRYGPGMMSGRFDRANDNDDGWSPAATVGVISIAVVLLLLIGVTVAYGRRGWRPATDGGAAAILDRRFAAGEIDSEEYQRRRAALSGGASR